MREKRRKRTLSLHHNVYFLVIFLGSLFCGSDTVALDTSFVVPDPLKPWVQWVIDRHEERECAYVQDLPLCEWPGKLTLKLTDSGGEFVLDVATDKKQQIALPGGRSIFPQNVRRTAGGEVLPVLEDGDRPLILLNKGVHNVYGTFSWGELPKVILIPAHVGLVELEVRGKKVNLPKISAQGELWLEEQASVSQPEEDSVRIEIFRKLEDGAPFKVTTALFLRVAGKAREENIGEVFLPGSTLIQATSALNYRLDANNSLTMQLKPGEHTSYFTAVYQQPPETLTPQSPAREGVEPRETWVFQADEELRSVELQGVSAIDAGRTNLPPEWHSLPAYILDAKDILTFNTLRRGEKQAAPNIINVARTLYLDLDGEGFTSADSLTGTVSQVWRLNAAKGVRLGRVSAGGSDQLITEEPETKAIGVELRSQAPSLQTVSRLEGSDRDLSAVGWDFDANSLSIALQLPPGWLLLEAFGADTAHGSWLSSWSLMDVFLVILVAIASAKLLGGVWGLAALCYLILTHHDAGAPRMVFIHLLACVAMLRGVPEGTLKKFVNFYYYTTLALLSVLVVAYTLAELREGMYPQLGGETRFELSDGLSFLVEQTFFGWTFLLVVLWSLYSLFVHWRWKYAILLLLATFVGYTIFQSTTQIFFNYDASFDQVAEVAQAPMPANETYQDLTVQYNDLRGSGGVSGVMRKMQTETSRQKELVQIDPNAAVQTGPGVPNWRWRTWQLNWSGSVGKEQRLELYLLNPGINFVLSLLRVLLLLILGALFLRSSGMKLNLKSFSPVILLVFSISPAQAQNYPPENLLKELETRLMVDECRGECALANTVQLKLAGDRVELRASISASDDSTWSIPGPLDQLLPSEVRVDGLLTSAMRRDEQGMLWVKIPKGVHRLEIVGRLLKPNSVTLQFVQHPSYVSFESSDWDIDGLSPTGHVEDSVQLTRKVALAGEEESRLEESTEISLPEWYLVKRTVSVGLTWEVDTIVERLGGGEKPAIAKVPLLFGKAVTTEGVKVEGDYAVVNFPRGVTTASWKSVLEVQPELVLVATSDSQINEIWSVQCSAIWRCQSEGLSAVSSAVEGVQGYRWRPYPGEEVKLVVTRPEGVKGQTVTVDSAHVTFTPGREMMRGIVQVKLRASKGGFEKLILPEGAIVQASVVNRKEENLRPDGREVTLPITPGSHEFEIRFQMPWSDTMLTSFPALRLQSAMTNVNVSVAPPQHRWILFAGGPSWGPAVLFWSKLVAVILFALVLGYSKAFPLSTTAWVLLGLGLANLSAYAVLMPVLWFAAMKYRKDLPLEARRRFNFFQFVLVVLTLLMLSVLYQAVWSGLILSPDMQIRGNNSHNGMLNWYTDLTDGTTPQPWLLSLHIYAWRALMLAWSSWMVFALIRWLKWGFEAFSTGGFWRSKED